MENSCIVRPMGEKIEDFCPFTVFFLVKNPALMRSIDIRIKRFRKIIKVTLHIEVHLR